ncbi:MAG TPA: hypothetical protein VK358_00365 [Longimicrobium sp.]|nr:hypothetical protein [Longimicrobium sp.]
MSLQSQAVPRGHTAAPPASPAGQHSRRFGITGARLMMGFFFLIAVPGLVWISRRDVPTQFKVTAETESLEFFTDVGTTLQFNLGDVDLYTDDGERKGVSGTLLPADSVTVIVSRVASGPLRVKLIPRSTAGFAGYLRGPNVQLRGMVDLKFASVAEASSRGENVAFHFTGRRVRIGQVSGTMSGTSVPLVRTGRVALFGRSFQGLPFEAGSYDLGPGDMMSCGEESCSAADTVMWTGLFVADERPALNGVFAAEANEIWIYRGTEGHPLSVSLIDRVIGDPGLAGLWVMLAFLGQVVTGLLTNELQRRADSRRRERGTGQ